MIRGRKQPELQISERELLVMTRDLDEVHHATMPMVHDVLEEMAEPIRSGSTRRRFLMGSGVAVAGVALAACGSSKKSTSSSNTTAAAGAGGGAALTGDLAVAGLAAALENTAVATYGAGIQAAVAGKLGKVPDAVVTFAKTAQSQHQDHSGAWNAILKQAGKSEVKGVDLTVKTQVVDPTFAQVKDVVGLAKLALALEDVAAATYLNGIQNALTSNGAIKVAATIQPVEMQHSAILAFILGMNPIPSSFAKTTGARGPSDQIG